MSVDATQLAADMAKGTPGQTWTPQINWIGHDHGTAVMVPAKGGMWVSVSDYLALTARVAELEGALVQIASCESFHPNDVVGIARAAIKGGQ